MSDTKVYGSELSRAVADAVAQVTRERDDARAEVERLRQENNLAWSSERVARTCAADHRAQIERIVSRHRAKCSALEDEARRWNEAATRASEEVERLRAVLRGVVEALRVLPPADRASYWYRTTMDAICGAVAKVGGA